MNHERSGWKAPAAAVLVTFGMMLIVTGTVGPSSPAAAAGAATVLTAAPTTPQPPAPTTAPVSTLAPTPAPTAAPGPLVGVCIVGGTRTVPIAWENLWRYGVEQLQPEPARRRVIVETTFLESDCTANPHNKDRIAECVNEIRSAKAFLASPAVTEHPTRRFDLHVDDGLTNCSHPFAANHSCCKHQDGDERMRDPPHGVWGLKQYLRKAQCSDRLLRMEKETGVAFDVIMWVRPDFYLFDTVPSAAALLQSPIPRVIFHADFISIAIRPYTVPWHRTLYHALGAQDCTLEGRHAIPERRLEALAKNSGIPTQFYPIFGVLARSDRVADCWRLDWMLFHLLTAKHEPSGQTLDKLDLCKRRFPGSK